MEKPLFKIFGSLLNTILVLTFISKAVPSFIITDLQSTNIADFNLEAAHWSSSPLISPGSMTSICEYPIIGGYQVASGTGGAYFTRTYTDLPSHNAAQVAITIYPIDSWDIDSLDTFEIAIDGTTFADWRVWTFSNPLVTKNICGNPNFYDIPPMHIQIVVPHQGTSMTIRVQDHLDCGTFDESLGFRNITILLLNETSTPTATICGKGAISLADSRYCSCGSSQYMSPEKSGMCYNCDLSCATCTGASSGQCSSCPSNTFFVCYR